MKNLMLTILLVFTISTTDNLQAYIWDITENTDITFGDYDHVRVDYENPLGYTKVNVYGGNISMIQTYYNSEAYLFGGKLHSVNVIDSSQLTYSGGTLSYLNVIDDSIATIIGKDFRDDFGEIDYGEIPRSSGRLFGVLEDGEEFMLLYNRTGNASIIVIPEPCSLSLLTFAFLLLRKKMYSS